MYIKIGRIRIGQLKVCATCKHWENVEAGLTGECALAAMNKNDDGPCSMAKSAAIVHRAAGISTIRNVKTSLLTSLNFSCNQWEGKQ